MAGGFSGELLLSVDHVKYRKAGEGRSPIGRIFVYRDHVEWKDNAGPEILFVKFGQIKGQRVSPPSKPKVQLQICMHNEDQATFVFMDPGKSRDQLVEQRELLKETLQQALLADRARINKMTASEDNAKNSELRQKEALLNQNQQLQDLYRHLVVSKLISPSDFWSEHFNTSINSSQSTGVNGAFLSTIATQEGTNGVKLNLNAEIIQAIFNMYPAVERKHLELVPHDMNEQMFWTKFFQSHYYHREREVLPNPSDPFSDCVKLDEAEIEKIVNNGVARKRFDLDSIDDNLFLEFSGSKLADSRNSQGRLVRRCNYLSERILETLKPSSSTSMPNGVTTANGTKNTTGFNVLNRIINEEEARLESSELTESEVSASVQEVKFHAASTYEARTHCSDDALRYKNFILQYLNSNNEEEILNEGDDLLDDDDDEAYANGESENNDLASDDEFDWGLSPQTLNEVRLVHDGLNELLKHFWTCFPPVTEELEAKVIRMDESLRRYEDETLGSAIKSYGPQNFQHCLDMLKRAHDKYAEFKLRKKK